MSKLQFDISERQIQPMGCRSSVCRAFQNLCLLDIAPLLIIDSGERGGCVISRAEFYRSEELSLGVVCKPQIAECDTFCIMQKCIFSKDAFRLLEAFHRFVISIQDDKNSSSI